MEFVGLLLVYSHPAVTTDATTQQQPESSCITNHRHRPPRSRQKRRETRDARVPSHEGSLRRVRGMPGSSSPSTVGSHVRRRTRPCGVVVEWRMSMSGADGEGRIDVLVWLRACCQSIGDDTQPWQVCFSVRGSCSCTYTLPSRTTPRRSSSPSRHPSTHHRHRPPRSRQKRQETRDARVP